MIKGCQKKMIMLRTTGNRFFEEAYFVLRDAGSDENITNADMVREANRVISENLLSVYCEDKMGHTEKKRGGLGALRPFLLGALSGGGAMGAVWIIMSVLVK